MTLPYFGESDIQVFHLYSYMHPTFLHQAFPHNCQNTVPENIPYPQSAVYYMGHFPV